MKAIQLVFLGVILLSALQFISAEGDFELIMVAEFFRHGARGPLGKVLNDNWTYGGELTEVGLRQHYIEGVELRKRYNDLLPATYNYTFIHTQSTNYNRTIMSCLAHNLGLFPLETGPTLPEDYPAERAVPPFQITTDPKTIGNFAIPNGYQPVPVHTVEGTDDYILNSPNSCPKLVPHHSTFLKSDWWAKTEELFKPLYDKWSEIFGVKNLNLDRSHSIFDSFYADWFQNNYTAVDIDDPIVANLSMTYQMALGYYDYPNEEALKLATQPTLEKLFEVIDNRVRPNGSLMKWFTFSGHDDNILNFMIAFNLTSLECQEKRMSTGYNGTCLLTPPYASLILFEIYNNTKTGDTYLKFKLNDEEYDWCPNTAKKAGAEGFCEYKALKTDLKKRFFVDNWKEACGITTPNNANNDNFFIILFLVFTCLIVALAAGVGVIRKKVSHSFLQSNDSFGSGNSGNSGNSGYSANLN